MKLPSWIVVAMALTGGTEFRLALRIQGEGEGGVIRSESEVMDTYRRATTNSTFIFNTIRMYGTALAWRPY
jgi:hypothetical protein